MVKGWRSSFVGVAFDLSFSEKMDWNVEGSVRCSISREAATFAHGSGVPWNVEGVWVEMSWLSVVDSLVQRQFARVGTAETGERIVAAKRSKVGSGSRFIILVESRRPESVFYYMQSDMR